STRRRLKSSPLSLTQPRERLP
ncbi:hlyD secretion family protein, partial [Vibrio parahaemolyticus EKP-021]